MKKVVLVLCCLAALLAAVMEKPENLRAQEGESSATVTPTPAPSISGLPEVPSQTKGLPTVKSGNYEYCLYGETAVLTKIFNYGEKVVIPESIDGHKVVALGRTEDDWYRKLETNVYGPDEEYAAVLSPEDTTVKQLVIPEGVRIIFPYAFNTMKGLTELKLPDSMEKIEEDNFKDALGLKKLIVPDNMSVGDYALFLNIEFDEVVLKGSFKAYDEDYGGIGCKRIRKLVVENNSSKRKFYDGKGKETPGCSFSFSKDMKLDTVVVKKPVSELYIDSGNITQMILKNPATKVTFAEWRQSTSVKKITATITKIKRKKKAKKYCYSWKPLKVSAQNWDSNSKPKKWKVTYKVEKKGKNGKYKTVKNVKKPQVKLAGKEKLRVAVVLK